MSDVTIPARLGRAGKKYGPGPAFVAGWAALGIALSGATQLRVAGVQLGPAEAVLTMWILFVTFLLLRGLNFTTGRVFLGVTAYWLASSTLLGLGAMVAVHTRTTDMGSVFHDVFAFTYLAVLSVFLSLSFHEDDDNNYHLHMARMTFIFNAVAAGVLVGVANFTSDLGPIRLLYAGVRFRGWAENPNQMAIALVAMPFLGAYLVKEASGVARKAAYSLGIGFCVAAGLATQSDALRLAWTASIGLVGIWTWHRAVLRGRARWLHISHVIVPALVVFGLLFFGTEIAAYFERLVELRYEEQDQGARRTTLWANGLKAITQSPLVGFGPGAYSGKAGPFEGNEAHNSLIDWGMSSGFIGILLHVLLLGWCAFRAIKSNSVMLLAMLTSLILLSQLHYSMRHPTYWLTLILVVTLTERRVGPVARRATAPRIRPESPPVPPARSRARRASLPQQNEPQQ